MGQEMTGVTFGSGWTGSGDNGFSVSISGDVNGQTAVQQFAAGTDDDFVLPLTVTAGPGSLLHLVVVAVAQRDPAYPDAAAAVRPVSIDAEIPLPS